MQLFSQIQNEFQILPFKLYHKHFRCRLRSWDDFVSAVIMQILKNDEKVGKIEREIGANLQIRA